MFEFLNLQYIMGKISREELMALTGRIITSEQYDKIVSGDY